MSNCPDSKYRDLLAAYELGMLSEEERRELEIHLLECEECRREAVTFAAGARLLRADADVRRMIDEIDSSPAAAKDRLREEHTGAASPRRFRMAYAWVAAAAVLTLLLLRPWQLSISPTDDVVAQANRLVVTEFENLTDPADSLRLGRILSNLLITDLSESHFVDVLSNQGLFDLLKALGHPGDRPVDAEVAAEVAHRAGARWILAGKVVQTEPQLTVTLQLIDYATGDVIASHRLGATGGASDVFGLVDSMTVRVKEDLSLPRGAFEESDPRVATVTTVSADAYRHYLEGVESERKFYWREAMHSYERALDYDSTFAMAYYRLSSLKDPQLIEDALKYISRAGRREQHYIRSRVAAVRGDQAGAVREMLELLKDYPREKDALLTVGIYFYQQHDYEQALAYLHRAIAIDSSFKQALNQIAYTYDKLGYFDSALAALDRYQEIAPNEANPYDSRGSLLAERGRFKEALAAFEQALAVRPDFYSSLWQAAFLYLYDHNYARSEELLQKIASSPNKGARCGGRTYLSYIPVYEGDFARALQMLDDGIAADRIEKTNIFDAPRKHLQKAMIYDELGDPQAAVNEAMLLVQGSANLPSHDSCFALPYLVQFQVRNGDLDAARRTAERLKACEAASSDSATYSWYADGWIKRASGDPTGAIASFKRAAELVDDFPTRYMLGVAFLESHQYEQAAATLEPLTRMHGSWRPSWCTWNVRLHYYLGWAYEELGNVTEARRQYGVFLDFWGGVTPEMPVVTETRTRLARLGTTP